MAKRNVRKNVVKGKETTEMSWRHEESLARANEPRVHPPTSCKGKLSHSHDISSQSHGSQPTGDLDADIRNLSQEEKGKVLINVCHQLFSSVSSPAPSDRWKKGKRERKSSWKSSFPPTRISEHFVQRGSTIYRITDPSIPRAQGERGRTSFPTPMAEFPCRGKAAAGDSHHHQHHRKESNSLLKKWGNRLHHKDRQIMTPNERVIHGSFKPVQRRNRPGNHLQTNRSGIKGSTNRSDEDRAERNRPKRGVPTRLSGYTPLAFPVNEIFKEIKNRRDLRWPPRLRNVPYKSHEYCQFHRGYGHTTENCYNLRDEIEDLVQRGLLEHYVSQIEEEPAGDNSNL